MTTEQIFVGGIAIAIGLLSVVAGASNLDIFFQAKRFKWIETRGGRPIARALYAMIGVTLIGLGVAIAMGFAPNASVTSS
mgnify:CR=1 FL=1|jgi:uncharacterized membrane protein YphA (DoxX/SURF4 family)